jgi:hypothetical protein
MNFNFSKSEKMSLNNWKHKKESMRSALWHLVVFVGAYQCFGVCIFRGENGGSMICYADNYILCYIAAELRGPQSNFSPLWISMRLYQLGTNYIPACWQQKSVSQSVYWSKDLNSYGRSFITSLAAWGSATHENVMSAARITSEGVCPCSAPAFTKSRHCNRENTTNKSKKS